MTLIRPATELDDAAIAVIWNHYSEHTIVTFTTDIKTPESLGYIRRTRAGADEPFFVAEEDGHVLGFATYSAFRNGPGYAFAKEHTLMLAPDAPKGTGLGRKLIEELCSHGRAHNIHSMMAGISQENEAAIHFHAACGFIEVARVPQVGWKFDRWHDLVLMQRFL